MTELALEIPKILMQELISWGLKEAFSFSRIKYLLKTLEKKKRILEAWLLDADATQLPEGPGREFKLLISELENLHDLLDLAAARAMRRQLTSRSRTAKKVLMFLSPSNPIICAFREAREVKALTEELGRIATSHNQLASLLKQPCNTVSQKEALSLEKGPFTSQVVIGRDKDRDNIIRMLLESSSAQEAFSVVCIVGIGGMGKTTLAQYVFSDGRVKSHFDLMIWVCVRQSLTVKEVMRNMVAFATDGTDLQGGMLQPPFTTDDTHLQGRMLQLRCHFQRQITNKKFLLVLDNVWNHELLSLQWQDLVDLIGFGAPGSRVLATTRSVGVARTMGVINPYILMDLAKDDSWELFKRVAFTPAQGRMLQLECQFQRQITNKKFLLVLDNILNHELLSLRWLDMVDLRAFGAPESMVLATTRSVGVASTMGVINPYMLMDLAQEDSWDLFKSVAFAQGQGPGVEAIGREIVQMCPDVPLVICNTGHHLKGKCDIKEWVDFKDRLSHLRSCREAPNVMEILKLSYDELDPKLKLCFAYCSLFPKDHRFSEDFLIHLWIALGYVDSQSENQNLVDIARDYSRRLKDQGFFNSDEFGMHDVMRDLAGWVAGPTYKRVYSSEGLEFDDERIHHLSLIGDGSGAPKDWPYSLLIKWKKQLHSLLIFGNGYFNTFELSLPHFECLRVLSIKAMGLNEMPRTISKLITLRYLDLSGNNFTELPNSITQLAHLTYLNLSACRELQELPRGLSKLQNLLELDLSRCSKLQELTGDMSKLVKLRVLRLSGCQKLRHMPVGLGNCTGLQTLSVFVAKGRSLS